MAYCKLCWSTVDQGFIGYEKFSYTGLALWHCDACNFAYLHPTPTDSELHNFYATQYRKVFPTEIPSGRDFLEKGLYNFVAEVRFSDLEKYIQTATKICEIGSGYGAFLKLLTDRSDGAVVYAVEPDEEARRMFFSKGKYIKDLSCLPDQYFDLILSFHTLEHVRDPISFLMMIRKGLSDDGICIIEVPLLDEVERHWNNVHFAHLNYFSEDSLRTSFIAAGFDVVSTEVNPSHTILKGTVRLIARRRELKLKNNNLLNKESPPTVQSQLSVDNVKRLRLAYKKHSGLLKRILKTIFVIFCGLKRYGALRRNLMWRKYKYEISKFHRNN